jgi:transcription-repair coupling factor (superfamily II helicase)
VLVCTTIIESGIDVPTANTIIINRADRFGLAQLYQLRGRVGRSHHRAYAFLLVPHRSALTADAVKRLEAIESLEELGIGFTLATHDLEIRGAGEILGDEQSGHIQEIGFSLYMELLERAVRTLRAGGKPAFEEPAEGQATEVDLRVPALIPETYLPDVHARLILYKRIAGARDEEDLSALREEIIDRFGPLPEPLRNLLAIARLKQRARALGVRRVDLGPQGGRVHFEEKAAVDPGSIIRLIQTQPQTYRLDGRDKLRIARELDTAAERISALSDLFDEIALRSAA